MTDSFWYVVLRLSPIAVSVPERYSCTGAVLSHTSCLAFPVRFSASDEGFSFAPSDALRSRGHPVALTDTDRKQPLALPACAIIQRLAATICISRNSI